MGNIAANIAANKTEKEPLPPWNLHSKEDKD